jgi:asparagine synthase (glutamine-hydrolysing)
MCGFAGYLDLKKTETTDQIKKNLEKMSSKIIHRGPDDSGIWIDKENGVYFCHRRLSVIDVLQRSRQPMFSKNYVILYNGEIYNHLEVRKKIDNFDWKTTSDTETIIAAFEAWGVEKSIKEFNGMFAIAVFNKLSKELTLIRDINGEKPLYYGWINDIFFFGSDLDSFLEHNQFKKEINNESFSFFLKYSFIPLDKCIYKNIFKLEKSSILSLKIGQKKFITKKYFNIEDIKKTQDTNYLLTFSDSKKYLELLLENSVRSQMLSDVPIGCFLSSGIDSSLIAALMQKNSKSKINTFSIGFHDSKFDEARDAKKIAKYLGTEHHELYIDINDVIRTVESLDSIYTEPFADSSQIPTSILSCFARKRITVALTGDGADELFGGYNRYIISLNLLKLINKFPQNLRNILEKIFFISPNYMSLKILEILNIFLHYQTSQYDIQDRLKKIHSFFRSKSIYDLYDNFISTFHNYNEVLKKNFNVDIFEEKKIKMDSEFASEFMTRDQNIYLTDDILCKVDRAAMYSSLETRLPFLDSKIIEFSKKIPLKFKIKNSTTKYILRKILSNYLPKDFLNKKKKGFSIPLNSWLKGPLNIWANDLINSKKMKESQLFDYNKVKKIFEDNINGKNNSSSAIWNILIFQQWFEKRF